MRALDDSTAAELSRLLALVAAELDSMNYPPAGIVHEAARRFATGQMAAPEVVCEGPGCSEVILKADGRPGPPAIYCSPRCKQASYRARQRDRSVT